MNEDRADNVGTEVSQKPSVPFFSSFPEQRNNSPPSFDSFPQAPSDQNTFIGHKRGRPIRQDNLKAGVKRPGHSHHETQFDSSDEEFHNVGHKHSRHRHKKPKESEAVLSYNVENRKGNKASTSKAPFTSDTETRIAEPHSTYVVDKRGDQDVRMYGRPYAGSIPKYRRLGYGHIVGLGGEFRIDQNMAYAGRGLSISAGNSLYKGVRLADTSVYRLLLSRQFRRTRLISGADKEQTRIETDTPNQQWSDFIALESTYQERHTDNTLGLLDNNPFPNASLLEHEKDSSDEEIILSDDAEGQSTAETFRSRSVAYNEYLKRNPGDVKKWLEFVDFQEEVIASMSDTERLGNKNINNQHHRRSLCETKISILEKALSFEQNRPSVELNLALLEYGGILWDPKTLLLRWKTLLTTYPHEIRFWVEYVAFRQTSSTNFHVDEATKVFQDCIHQIVQVGYQCDSESENGKNACQNLEETAVYLLLRLCLFLREAGYGERAFAVLQCMMEYNFFMPAQLREAAGTALGANETLSELGKFWDSESPRFGEVDSKGWCNTAEWEAGEHLQPVENVPPSSSKDENPYIHWHNIETSSSWQAMRPAKTTDPQAEDDPFATVFFEDIRNFVFLLTARDSRLQLFYSFLVFLGLPLVPPDTSSNSRLANDTFLRSSAFFSSSKRKAFWPQQNSDTFLRKLLPFYTIEGQPMEHIRASDITQPFQPPFKNYPISPDVLSPSIPPWFALLDHGDYMHELDLHTIRNVLQQAKPVIKDSFLNIIYIAVETTQSLATSSKLAKDLLKRDHNNLLLWDAYARVERLKGKLESARRVYANALYLSQSMPEREQIDRPLLWRAWAEMEWESGYTANSRAVLLASAMPEIDNVSLLRIGTTMGENIASTPTQVLKARRHIQRLLTSANSVESSQSLFRHRISITFMAALEAYLNEGLEKADAVIQQQLQHLQCENYSSSEQEELFALQAKLHYRHQQTGSGYRPKDLRGVLDKALSTFPNNTIFQSLYLFNELRTRLHNRVRQILEKKVLNDASVTSEGWLFAIYVELNLNSRTYNTANVRSLFERAVQSKSGRSSASIWRLYVEFECKNGQTAQVKSCCRQAVVQCPWSKELHLLPFSSAVRSHFNSSELQKYYQMMEEKGIRLHRSLDDVVGNWVSQEEDSSETDMPDTEDTVFFQEQSEERNRLLPH